MSPRPKSAYEDHLGRRGSDDFDMPNTFQNLKGSPRPNRAPKPPSSPVQSSYYSNRDSAFAPSDVDAYAVFSMDRPRSFPQLNAERKVSFSQHTTEAYDKRSSNALPVINEHDHRYSSSTIEEEAIYAASRDIDAVLPIIFNAKKGTNTQKNAHNENDQSHDLNEPAHHRSQLSIELQRVRGNPAHPECAVQRVLNVPHVVHPQPKAALETEWNVRNYVDSPSRQSHPTEVADSSPLQANNRDESPGFSNRGAFEQARPVSVAVSSPLRANNRDESPGFSNGRDFEQTRPFSFAVRSPTPLHNAVKASRADKGHSYPRSSQSTPIHERLPSIPQQPSVHGSSPAGSSVLGNPHKTNEKVVFDEEAYESVLSTLVETPDITLPFDSVQTAAELSEANLNSPHLAIEERNGRHAYEVESPLDRYPRSLPEPTQAEQLDDIDLNAPKKRARRTGIFCCWTFWGSTESAATEKV